MGRRIIISNWENTQNTYTTLMFFFKKTIEFDLCFFHTKTTKNNPLQKGFALGFLFNTEICDVALGLGDGQHL